MNPPKATAEDYIQFLIVKPKVCSATETARVQPEAANAAKHDAFTRLLHRLEPEPEELWREAAPQVERQGGVLMGGRFDLGQTLRQENRMGSSARVGQTPRGGGRNQPDHSIME